MGHIINPDRKIRAVEFLEAGNWSLWQISVGFPSCQMSTIRIYQISRAKGLELLEPSSLPLVLRQCDEASGMSLGPFLPKP